MLDKEIRSEQVQAIRNADGVAALFAELGYRTEARIAQTADVLAITPESAAAQTKKIERIADQDGLLQVYLFEVASLTQALTHAIARAFRNRAGHYLLVLTADYDRLDLVLVELVLASSKTESLVPKQVTLRPRVVSIERQNPDRVHLRLIRRLTYTESDPEFQFEKLRSAFDLAEWSEAFFNNRGLFSDYYLNERVPETAAWMEDPKPAHRALRELLTKSAERWAGKTKAEITDGLIKPAIEALGFTMSVACISSKDSPQPDYLLSVPSAPGSPVALCLIYPWGRWLDGKDDTRDAETSDDNPGARVVSLLESGTARWAILTNGKLWRLYSGKAHSRATNYYEIDLDETLAFPGPQATDAAEAFRYFWLIFRAKAFEGQPSFLDDILAGSEAYAKKLGDRLKERIFEEIFPRLAEGFIEYIRQRDGKQADLSQLVLDQIFQGTLTFLYRLLFILYAESRDLLPVKEFHGYGQKSLKLLKEEVAGKADDLEGRRDEKLSKAYAATGDSLYRRLVELCSVIDRGSRALNVPGYNGGLFMTDPPYDDETHEAKNARFLRDHVIPDQWLARGLDRLARDEDEKSHALVFIDYKSLGVRHLGSIYEGLLEFKLHIAAEKMAVVEGKKTEEIIPYGEAQESKRKILKTGRGKEAVERVLAPDTVYLENDRRERKAAGAYYTPDYIVQYIVEHAVGPVLEEKFAALTSKLRNAQKTLKQEQDKAAALRKTVGKHDDPEHQAYLKHRHLVDELFDVKVLDPAMGSGHFLVEAVDFLTDRMLHFLNGFPWNPVLAHLKETRETILQEMERQGISIDTGRLSDVNLLKRHVLKRCIYGVDLNPMAVELAKVSLWLDCFTLGAPLSFLDHHLKCGNSIIGATVDEVDKALETKGQTTFFHTSEFARELVAVDLMRRIGELSDVTPDQVRESRREFRNAVSALMPAKTVMDVYVSRWFGNEPVVKNKGKGLQDIALDFLRTTEAAQWLKHPEKLGDLNAKDQKLAETALLASREKRFFHWEIEFPEVFFAPRQGTTQIVEKKPNAGFDAVIGNPPWGADVVQDPLYVRDSFKLLSGKINLFALFTEKASLLKHHHGALAFVVPSLLMMSQQFTALRRYLLHTIHVSHILVLPKKQFPDAYVDSCVFVAGNGESAIEVLNLEEDQPGEIDLLCRQGQSVPIKQWDTEECLFEYRSAGGKITLPKPASTCIQPLETQFDVYYGLTPYSKASGQSDRVIKDQAYHSHEKSTPSHQPYLEGDDVDRYAINWSGLYIKYGSWLAGPKKPAHFSKGRLLIRESTGRARRIYACVDDLGYYHGHPIIAAKGTSNFSPLALSAVVNSTYMRKWHLTYSASSTKEDFPRILPGDVAKLPLRRIHFTTPKAERKAMIQKLVGLYESNRFADQLQEVDRLLPKDKDGSFMAFRPGATGVEEKSDVIHDLLVHLAELMMTLNKQKQAEMKRFLNWLETRLKIAPGKDGEATLHSLNRKTTLLNYLGDYQKSEDAEPFSTIVAVLRKNRARLGISMSDKATIDKIETEYQTSLSKLIPIKDRLAHTDRLIDQIVYKLYGLTDEEIAIVGSKP